MKDDRKLENYKIAKIKSSQKIISKEVIFLAVSLAVSLAVFFVFLLPEYKKMETVKFEKDLIKDNLKSREKTADKIEDFNKKYKDVEKKDLDKINNLLSDRNNFEEHLSYIDNFAKTNGILINDFTVTETSESDSDSESNNISNDILFEMVEINFSAKGTFSNLVSFLDSLEKNIPLVNLKKLNIKKNETEGKEIIEEIETRTEGEIEGTEEEIEEAVVIKKENIEEEVDADILEYDIALTFYYL